MLCSKCKKRPAVVFVSNNKEDENPQGLCITCAKEMGIKPVSDMMEKMGISDEDLDQMQDQLSDFISMTKENPEFLNEMLEGEENLPFFKDMFSDTNIKDSIAADEAIDKEKMSDTASKKQYKKKSKRKNIDSYCTNLTQKAKDNELDLIVGRNKEISRVIQILSRRTKNNPCLIGEPGVGKTAIAEGIAMRIVEGNVPAKLKSKEIQLLDLTSLIAGTQFRGQFESRIKGLLEEVKEAGNIILFIDEVHNLVGTGDSEGSMSAANILKPALSRGEIQVIGATTFSEYRKYIEKDSALERRFQPVTVVEPSVDETIDVLTGIKSYYEDYHRVKIEDALIRRVVVLSERYITERFLPDKAIDLLDESCACASLRNKEIEEYDNIKIEIDKLKSEEEKLSSEEEIDYEKLAKVRYDIARLDTKLNEFSNEDLNIQVTENDIAHVIELWTGIPSVKIKENEFKKLSKIDENLSSKIIGQDEAIKAISAAIKRSRVQINPRRRPASFIFVGPTGVGKTELAKVLSSELFDTPDNLIRLDMSEFMEKHSVSRIIGAPPGYIGYDEAGQLTEKVRRKPYSILLFDEIEKAHPDVVNILLQILDEGRITDAQGKTVNFENTVIIMTSNAGSNKIGESVGFAKSEADITKEKVMKSLSEFLRPEFLSRIDEIVIFNKLKEEDFEKIARLMLDEYVVSLKEKGITFSFDEKILSYLAKKSVGGKSAARDLRNLIRREVEDKIATIIVEKQEIDIKTISATASDKVEINFF